MGETVKENNKRHRDSVHLTIFSLGPKCTLSLCLLLLVLCYAVMSDAGDEPFASPTNWGGTGLMETPTARVLREGRYRFGVSQVDPYRYYYGAISPLKGLEA